jgi:hypothetical protein
MRRALGLLAALATACGVPQVNLVGDDAGLPEGGSVDASVEAGADAGAGAHADAMNDAPDDDRVGDAPYCFGKGPPPGAKCCPSGGPVCYGTCNKNDCAACGTCPYPSFCCTAGPTGTCQSTPCNGADAGDGGGD